MSNTNHRKKIEVPKINTRQKKKMFLHFIILFERVFLTALV